MQKSVTKRANEVLGNVLVRTHEKEQKAQMDILALRTENKHLRVELKIMQKAMLTNAGTDARTNDDKEFLSRANRAQKLDIVRTLQTKKPAESGIEFSMFDDVKKPDADGQISIF